MGMEKGIGTYKERVLHASLKQIIEPNTDKQEIKYKSFVCDIKNDHGIFEIQTRSFNALRKKLEVFLEEDLVTIVYPSIRNKWLIWVDPETGETSSKRKSNKKGSPLQIFSELYKIKFFLTNPNLRIKIIETDVEEYRILDGWSVDRKKGSTRAERIPIDYGEIIDITCETDYQKLIPSSLDDHFTSEIFAKAGKITLHRAQTALHVLSYVGAIRLIGKDGRKNLYKK